MKYSLVFLGDRNKEKILEEITSNLKLPTSSFQVVFLSNKEQKKENLVKTNLNFKTVIFEKFSSNESMFEAFIQNKDIGHVIFFKESAVHLNFKDINRMIEEQKKGSLLVVSKQNKKENKFTKIIKHIRNFLVKMFLNVELFEDTGDIMLFDRILVATMQEMPGKSASLTKINSWVGVSPKYIVIDAQPVKKNKYKIKNFISSIILFSIFVGLLITDIILGVLKVKINFIFVFLLIAGHLIILIMLLYFITKKLFQIKFGDLGIVPEARILEEFNNFDE